ncbi:MAG: sulfotransferase [Dokdonella sp.]
MESTGQPQSSHAASAALESALIAFQQQLAASGAPKALAALMTWLDKANATSADWAYCAESILRSPNPPASIHLLEQARERWPQDIELRYQLGNALRMGGDDVSAESVLRALLVAAPAHADAARSLAFLLREQGRLSAAAQCVLTMCRNAPRSRDSDLRAVNFLRECQRLVLAEDLVAECLGAWPDDADLNALGGEIALNLGRFGVARGRLRKAVEADPQRASAWLRLAHTRRFKRSDASIRLLLQQAQRSSDLRDEARTSIEFALGKIADDLGDYPEAARNFMAANARMKRRSGWQANGWNAFVEQQLASSQLSPSADVSSPITPVFVVGLPRSGTTLCATLLARHLHVRGRGELNWIAALAARLGANPSPEMRKQAASLYLAQLQQDDTPASHYIDKNPLNFRHLGLIATLFPNARIIHCRRGLRDNALSIWSQMFAHDDNGYAYDLADIAGYARGYQRLMEHWKARLALPVFDLDYESMARDPDSTIRDLYDFLDLVPNEIDSAGADSGGSGEAIATASVWQARQPVQAIATASVWQARQPVHTQSIERWRHYAAHVPDLLTAFPD